MSYLRSLRRWPLLPALLACFSVTGAGPRPLVGHHPSQPSSSAALSTAGISGWFHVVYGDPPPGEAAEPAPLTLLTDDRGRTFRLVVPDDLAQKMGGIQSFDRRRVDVQGRWLGHRSGAIAVTGLQLGAAPEREAEPIAALEFVNSVSKPYALILCRFADTAGFTPHPKSYYDGLMGDTYPGASHYWREASFNAVNLVGSTTYGWYNLPRPRAYYMTAAGDEMDMAKLFADATAAADADINYRSFAGINILVNDDLKGPSRGGGFVGTLDGLSQVWPTTWLLLWAHVPAYTAHEVGHSLGLMHSSGPYQQAYDSRWDVMSGGGSFRSPDPVYGPTPVHTLAWHKDKLGWMLPKQKYVAQPGSQQTIQLTRVAQPPSNDDYLMAQIFVGGWGTRFYTVELRQFAGYDSVGALPGEAVLINRVDTTLSDRNAQIVDADGNGDPNDGGAMWTPGETFTDTANGVSIRIGDTTPTGIQVTISVGSDVPLPNVVSNTGDQGPGSLRNAILFANQFPGTTIQFGVPQGDAAFGSGVFTLQPTVPLPAITGSGIVIDGGTQLSRTGDTNAGLPALVLNGARAGARATGLQITGGGCQVRRLTVNGFSGDGIRVFGTGAVGNAVQGCLVGTNGAGTAAQPNGGFGIVVDEGARQTLIGGSVAGAGNVVSGNALEGIRIEDSGTAETLVQGNSVGTDVSGTRAIPNGLAGIGVAFGARNNTIGGTTAGARNLISGNRGQGLVFFGAGTEGNVAQGNFIGTNATGQLPVPNSLVGVAISGGAKGNTLGGTAAGAGNLISGNVGPGLVIQSESTSGTVVQGNLIGTNATGTAVLANGTNAVEIGFGTQNNTLGGTIAGARNVIAGNGDAVVLIFGPGTRGNVLQGNLIGTDSTGTRKLGNSGYGVALLEGASGNTIGGASVDAGNQIAFQAFNGIVVLDATSVGNTLRANRLFGNGAPGINLWGGAENGWGVTNNDPGDTDIGPNNLQNYPTITEISLSDGATVITGTLNSTPGATFTLDFYASATAHPSSFGEGALYLGSTSVTTDGGGNAGFVFRTANALPGSFVSATATNAGTGDTSEFSQARKGP